MFTALSGTTWLAILISTVVCGGLAGAYFTLVVPKPYSIALGRQNAPAPVTNAVTDFGPVACILVTVIASAVLIRALGITSIGDALLFGLVVGIGYLTAMTFQIGINPNFPRPILYGLINAPFFIGCALISSVIITLVG